MKKTLFTILAVPLGYLSYEAYDGYQIAQQKIETLSNLYATSQQAYQTLEAKYQALEQQYDETRKELEQRDSAIKRIYTE